MSAEAFGKYVREESARYARLLPAIGMTK
jgi:hypothetical protein